ncbi:MAG TPA: hypothetical protein VHL30_03840, partial [Chlamydiales bacterium]|nr:hypothetical protein [Chlamydiales bacterium]
MRTIVIIITIFSGFIKSYGSEKISPICESTSPDICSLLHKISRLAFYFGVGSFFTTSSDLASLGWGFCQLSPQMASTGNELFLFSRLSSSIARHAHSQMLKEFNASMTPFPISQFSWQLNYKLLSEIPAFSNEDLQLLRFLQERWLAKIAGFSALTIDWVYPCFDVYMQIHPSSNHAYARVLTTRFSKAYSNRMEAWKQTLPHPHHYPLILTRPANLQEYLPPHLEVSDAETVQQLTTSPTERIVLDLTNLFPEDVSEWANRWQMYCNAFAESTLDPNQILCIQRIYQQGIGGIRLLPLPGQSAQRLEEHYQFLLDWISCFGLAANRIELDRWPVDTPLPPNVPLNKGALPTQEPFLSLLHSLEEKWSQGPPHKTLMLSGTLQVLKGIFSSLPEEKWRAISNCPTRSSIVQCTLRSLMQQLKSFAKKVDQSSFFEITSRLEQIHANLSALLEIAAP